MNLRLVGRRVAVLIAGLLHASALAAVAPLMTVSPTWIKAGAEKQFAFTWNVAGERVGPGGGFEIVFWCQNSEVGTLLWSCPQTEDPSAPGYLTAVATGAEVDLSIRGPRIARVDVRAGSLENGEVVRLVWRGRVQTLARTMIFKVRWRPDAATDWISIPESRSASVDVLPLRSKVAMAFAPADVAVGEPFDLAVSVLDRYGNPARDYQGVLRFSSTDPDADLPAPTAFEEGAPALRIFSNVRFGTAGLHRIRIEDDQDSTREVDANWTEVHAGPPPLRRWFGETHFHTGAGAAYDGWSTRGGDHKGNYARLEDAYRYLRDVWRLDFGAAAEHDFDQGLEERELVRGVTEAFYEPGRFTTFHAFEWTRHQGLPEGGHRVVLYGAAPGAVFSSADERWDTQSELFTALRGQGLPALVIPHPMQPDPHSEIWAVRADDLQRVTEVYSVQNRNRATGGDPLAFEMQWGDAWAVREAWRQGHRLGLIGSSDNHIGTPGYNRISLLTEHTDGGYAVVLAPANDRPSLFSGLREARAYATTGHRALLRLEAGGHPMGSVAVWSGGAPRVEGYVAGTAPLEKVWVFRADHSRGFVDLRPADLDPREEIFAFDFEDSGWDRSSLYYLRAKQADGEIAWSSPVWLLQGAGLDGWGFRPVFPRDDAPNVEIRKERSP